MASFAAGARTNHAVGVNGNGVIGGGSTANASMHSAKRQSTSSPPGPGVKAQARSEEDQGLMHVTTRKRTACPACRKQTVSGLVALLVSCVRPLFV